LSGEGVRVKIEYRGIEDRVKIEFVSEDANESYRDRVEVE